MTRRNVSRYKFPRFTHRDLEAFKAAPLERGVHSFWYHQGPFDLLLQPKAGSDTLLVSFHPALQTADASIPVFMGLGVTHETGAHRLFLSDPSLERDDQLRLAWHTGNYLQPLQRDLPRVIEHVRAEVGARHVVFSGTSGGGFAAMYYSAMFPGSLAVVVNPQTVIPNYLAKPVARYMEVCWPRPTWSVQWDLREVYAQWPGNTVAYLQNRSDSHVEKHLEPFLEAVRAPEGALHLLLGEWGEGHKSPPKELIAKVLQDVAAVRGDWGPTLAGLGFMNRSAGDVQPSR